VVSFDVPLGVGTSVDADLSRIDDPVAREVALRLRLARLEDPRSGRAAAMVTAGAAGGGEGPVPSAAAGAQRLGPNGLVPQADRMLQDTMLGYRSQVTELQKHLEQERQLRAATEKLLTETQQTVADAAKLRSEQMAFLEEHRAQMAGHAARPRSSLLQRGGSLPADRNDEALEYGVAGRVSPPSSLGANVTTRASAALRRPSPPYSRVSGYGAAASASRRPTGGPGGYSTDQAGAPTGSDRGGVAAGNPGSSYGRSAQAPRQFARSQPR